MWSCSLSRFSSECVHVLVKDSNFLRSSDSGHQEKGILLDFNEMMKISRIWMSALHEPIDWSLSGGKSYCRLISLFIQSKEVLESEIKDDGVGSRTSGILSEMRRSDMFMLRSSMTFPEYKAYQPEELIPSEVRAMLRIDLIGVVGLIVRERVRSGGILTTTEISADGFGMISAIVTLISVKLQDF